MKAKEYVRVKAGELSLGDLRSGKSIKIIGLGEFYSDVEYGVDNYGRQYEKGRTLNRPVVTSILDHFDGDKNITSQSFNSLIRSKAVDDLFVELLELDNIGQQNAILSCIALKKQLPDLKNLFATIVHREIFVRYSTDCQRIISMYRGDMLSTILRTEVARKCARKLARDMLEDTDIMNPPDYREVAELACTMNTDSNAGFMIDSDIRKAEVWVRDMISSEVGLPNAMDPRQYTKCAMSHDQREAFNGIIGCNAGIMTLQGMPGSGKSHLISALVSYYGEQGSLPVVTSFMNKACLNLQERMPKYQIRELYRDPCVPTIHSLYGKLTAMKEPPMLRTPLLIVDESSVLSSELLSKLMTIHKFMPSARILFVGDSNQLPPVCSYGTPFHNMMKNRDVRKFSLSEFHRSNGKGIFDLITRLKNLDDDGFLKISKIDDVDLFKTPSTEQAAAVGQILAYNYRESIRDIATVCETNHMTNMLNISMAMGHLNLERQSVRTRKRGNDDILVPDLVGMRVVVRQNFTPSKKIHGRGAKNEFGTLVEYDATGATVRLDIMDREVHFDDASIYLDLFDAGYASTVHKFQGSECKEILYILDNDMNLSGNAFYVMKEMKYVALSRAKCKLDIVAIERGSLRDTRRVESVTIRAKALDKAMMCF